MADKAPTGISPDGEEGPGSYGLNRKMTLTILVANKGKVTANFALVQRTLREVAVLLGNTFCFTATVENDVLRVEGRIDLTKYEGLEPVYAEYNVGHYVRAFWYRAALTNGAPAWRYNIPADASPENTDYNRFLGPAPKTAFNKNRYFQWRLYWDYSGGISTDLLVHQTDISNFVMGKTVPSTCMASGGIYRWTDPNDDREVPDTLSAIYEYPDKFHINYSCYFGNVKYGYGEQFMGNEGTIEVLPHLPSEHLDSASPACRRCVTAARRACRAFVCPQGTGPHCRCL